MEETDAARHRWADGRGRRWWLGAILAFWLAFFGTDVVTENVSGDLATSLWFPPTGIAVVMLLLTGARGFAPVAVAYAAHLAVFRSFGGYAPVGALLITGLYAAAAEVFLRQTGTRWLRGLGEVARFAGLLCIAAPLLVAAVTGVGLAVVGRAPWDEFGGNLVAGVAGDGTGIAVVVPLAAIALRLLEGRRQQRLTIDRLLAVPGFSQPSQRSRLELAAQVVMLAGTVVVAYGVPQGANLDYAYLAFVPLVWIAVRDSFDQAVIAVVVFNVAAVVLVGADSGAASPVMLQFGLMVATLLTLLLAASTSDYRHAQERRRRGEARLRSIVENASDAVKIVDLDGTLRWASPAFVRLFGHDHEDAVGANVLQWVHPEDLATVTAATQRAVDEGEGAVSRAAYRFRHADGHYVPVESVATYLLDDPAVHGVVLHVREVSERNALQARLEHMAFHDGLTQLPNRTLLLDRLQQALARSRRSGGDVAVMFLDLDDFKDINDTLGHEAGDVLLRACVERLGDDLRPQDTLARLGGDEFCLMVEGASARTAITLAERMLGRLTDAPLVLPAGDGAELRMTASIGVALAKAGAPDAGELLKRADMAMYRAKRDGGGRVALFEAALATDANRRIRLRRELDAALGAGELELHYQPNVDLETGQLRWMEALVRWRHPQRGLLLPADFIGPAEANGQIAGLGRAVLQAALAEQRRWRTELPLPVPGVAVNLSGSQLHGEHAAEELLGHVSAADAQPGDIAFEITESVFAGDDRALAALEHLRAAGVRLCIDDFGTGYSSLHALHLLPADALKVDCAFVHELGSRSGSAAVVAAIVALARHTGKSAIAECVETAEQLELLRQAGCELGQGYFFGAPMPAPQARELLCRATPAALLDGSFASRPG